MDLKKIFFCLLSILCFKYASAQEDHFVASEALHSCSHQQNSDPITFQENELTSNYNITYYRLNLAVKPDSQYISGAVTPYFIPSKKLSQIFFELNSLLIVDSILHNNNSVSFSHSDGLIKIQNTFDSHILDSLSIFYHGHPPEGTSFKTETHNDTPILWTLSEPYGAIDWWPCKQSLTDKADSVDIFVTCPKENKVAGNGVLQRTTINGNSATTHWKSSYPIAAYLIAMAVTPYAEINYYTTLSQGALFVQNYIYKEDSANHRDALFTTDTLLRYYDSLIGPYPFMNEKYGHAQWGRGGGMEHQTMSFMYHFRFNLTAHELAHQWFGNKITCGSWQDIWLNEGFATYFAGLPLEHWYQGQYWEEWKSTHLNRALANSSESIFVTDTSTFERIFDSELSYSKASYVLHMLRKQIGNIHFFKGIHTYISDPGLAYKTALTDDFFYHMEVAADTSLVLFKNQWIYGIGYPSFNIEWHQVNTSLEISLRQTTSNNATPFYNLKVPILLIGETDSLWVYPEADLNEETFNWSIDFQVSQVIIDPNRDLISKGNFVVQKSKFTDFTIYPNPTNQYLQIIPTTLFGIIDRYLIYSSSGQLIKSETNIPINRSFQIDVSYLPQGSYQVQINSGNNKRTEGFIISR